MPVFLSDKGITGDKVVFDFYVNPASIWEDIETSGYRHDYSLELEIQALPKELYLYYKSVAQQNYNEGGLFGQPMEVYSNIKNGKGIFAIANTVSQQVED